MTPIRLATSAGNGSRRGGALIAFLLVALSLAGMVAAVFTMGLAQKQEIGATANEVKALYVAEAAVSEALSDMILAAYKDEPMPTTSARARAH